MSKHNQYFEEALEWGSQNFPENKFKIFQSLINHERSYIDSMLAKETTTTTNVHTVISVFVPIIKKFVQDNFIDKIVNVQPVKTIPASVLVLSSVYSQTDTVSGATQGSTIDDGTNQYSRTPGEGSNITRGIDLDLRAVQTESTIRKLVAKWTFEAEDMINNLGINVMEELTRAMAWKITSEVQYHILMQLYNECTGGVSEWRMPGTTATPREVERAEKELFYRILDTASQIYKNDHGFYPNYIVCNPKIAAILKRQYNWRIFTDNQGKTTISSFFTEGIINDEFSVYVVRHLATDDILVGFKDQNNDISAGYVFCPYKFPFLTQPLADPTTLTIAKSVGAWFCTAFPMKNRYGLVKVVS